MIKDTTEDPCDRDDRSPRERLLGKAKEAANLPVRQRIFSVKGLIHERYRLKLSDIGHATAKPPARELPCSERDIFEAAFGDPLGAEYWRAWLFDLQPLSNATLADLLATHVADSEERFCIMKKALFQALEKQAHDYPRTAAQWLIENPNTHDFVPEGLTQLLSPMNVEAVRYPEKRGKARKILAQLFPKGIPDKIEMSDAELVRRVHRSSAYDDLPQSERPSKDTILRAAGRK
jgi:hypothetical protein